MIIRCFQPYIRIAFHSQNSDRNTSLGYHPMLDIGMLAVIFCSQELDLSLPQ
jgi:hypothetical protein